MIKNKRFIIFSYILLSVITVIVTLVWQAYRVEKQMRSIQTKPKIAPKTVMQEAEEIEPAELPVPARPEDYGMVVSHDFNQPRTQAAWNEFLQKELGEVKARMSVQEVERIKARIAEPSEKTEEKLGKINTSIQQCEEVLDKEPDNQEMQKKLEHLMILKGLTSAFEEF
ncbi:hypothetical protein ACFL1D_04275 [Candidatus Omnitrophota bacterium]